MNENYLGVELPGKSLVSAMLEKLHGLRKNCIILGGRKCCDSPRRIPEECFKAFISSLAFHLSLLKKKASTEKPVIILINSKPVFSNRS